MDHRIRLAMKTGTFQKLSGEVEFDEAFIGGSPKNYSKSKRKALAEAGNLPKGGSGHKTAIVGAKQRNGDVAASVARGTHWESLKDEVRAKVEPGSKLYTDAHRAYKRLYAEYDHALYRPRHDLRGWAGSHKRDRKLLGSVQARSS